MATITASYIQGLSNFISELELQNIQNPELSYQMARDGLIRTAVLDSDGRVKDKIVSYD